MSVVNKKLESLRSYIPLLDFTSSSHLISENKAIFKPDKRVDCKIHNTMATQIMMSIDIFQRIIVINLE